MPHVNKADLALLLGRSSNTVASEDENVQQFMAKIDFEPKDLVMLSAESINDDNLGDLVQNLHELTTFFQEPTPHKQVMPNTRLEARVVAILAKSVAGAPQTPFVDVFRVGSLDDYDDSDDDSASKNGSNLSSIGEVQSTTLRSQDPRVPLVRGQLSKVSKISQHFSRFLSSDLASTQGNSMEASYPQYRQPTLRCGIRCRRHRPQRERSSQESSTPSTYSRGGLPRTVTHAQVIWFRRQTTIYFQ